LLARCLQDWHPPRVGVPAYFLPGACRSPLQTRSVLRSVRVLPLQGNRRCRCRTFMPSTSVAVLKCNRSRCRFPMGDMSPIFFYDGASGCRYTHHPATALGFHQVRMASWVATMLYCVAARSALQQFVLVATVWACLRRAAPFAPSRRVLGGGFVVPAEGSRAHPALACSRRVVLCLPSAYHSVRLRVCAVASAGMHTHARTHTTLSSRRMHLRSRDTQALKQRTPALALTALSIGQDIVVSTAHAEHERRQCMAMPIVSATGEVGCGLFRKRLRVGAHVACRACCRSVLTGLGRRWWDR
jgi:hypothetical protein